MRVTVPIQAQAVGAVWMINDLRREFGREAVTEVIRGYPDGGGAVQVRMDADRQLARVEIRDRKNRPITSVQ